MWGDRYCAHPSYVLGFHGCDEDWGESVLRGEAHMAPSNNSYDWLGAGIYFWEGSPRRALEWATDAMGKPQQSKGRVKKPFVLGAVIDLGLCCNLFDSEALSEMRGAFDILKQASEAGAVEMPVNKGPAMELRFRDRAVIDLMNAVRHVKNLKPYDVIRAAFVEGGPLYDGAGLTERNHIQLAVRNTNNIKGYFRPIKADLR